MRYREAILDRQYLQARLADAATEIYMMSAVVARLERMLDQGGVPPAAAARDLEVGRYYCRTAARRVRQHLRDLGENVDAETTAVADVVIGGSAAGQE